METRLDIELVNRGLLKTRAKAKEAIIAGKIICNGKVVTKPSTLVKDNDKIEIFGNLMPYVSKGGLKLEKAINYFKVELENKIMLDIGSSTGGFTDCALQYGIKHVIAVDVGTNQMDPNLRKNEKITLFEQTDFRKMNNDLLVGVDIITIDVSFISVKLLLPKISKLKAVEEIICLVKPQFECGKELARKYKGIILDKNIHYNVIEDVICSFKKINYYCHGLTYSPIQGGDGNIEYLSYFKNMVGSPINIKSVVDEAFYELLEKQK
ncbi:MAG TPA: TlyA family RNA methyltransferase [Tenericutes bacterium]|nr:TlyA family RNA methyltransferase [Mycoplasmatota bacterium]